MTIVSLLVICVFKLPSTSSNQNEN